MNILTTLPTDSFVTAAFAELIADVDGLLKGAREQKPIDKDEVKFWLSQFNALNKAQLNYTQGVRPTIVDGAYLLPSASRPGALVHRLYKAGGIVVCSCEAGQKQTLCWHHMLINVIERAAEMESREQIEAEIVSGDGNDPTPAASEPWQIGAVIGRQLLVSRLDATNAYLDALRASQGRVGLGSQPAPRPLRVRLVEARRRSPYFASAFYLSKAA